MHRNGDHRLVPGFAAVVVCLLLAAPQAGLADQDGRGHFRFQHIALREGLSQAAVNAILQDRHGFMWFGTHEGLNRFDGYEFVVYQHDASDPSSLAHDTVRAIVEDRSGTLWIGTDNGGLDRFDESDQSFTHFQHDPQDPASLSSNRVRSIEEDPSGGLWIGTDGGGLNYFEIESATFTRYLPEPEDPSALSHGHVRAVYRDPMGLVWIGTDGGGLNVLDPASGRFSHYRHDPDDPRSLNDDHVWSIYEDERGFLWIGTADGGVSRFDRRDSTFRSFTQGDGSGLTGGTVRAIFQDRETRLLVGTEEGLNVWNPRREAFTVYRNDPSDPYSLSHNRIVSIYQDRGGLIWLGTLIGLNKWNPTEGSFQHYKEKPEDPTQLSNHYVSAFAEDARGGVWIGTLGGLNRFDPVRQSFERFLHDPTDSTSLAADRIGSLWADDDGTLWVGTATAGLDHLDPESGRFEHYFHDPDDPASLSFNGVTTVYRDRAGTLWVGTYRGGLNQFDSESGGFVHHRHDPQDPRTLSSDRVVAVREDRDGNLWIGTDGGGLNRYDRRREVFEHYTHDPTDAESLSSDHVWTISEGPDGDLWLGTQGGGLNRWSRDDVRSRKPAFRRYLKKDGLLSTVIYATVWDAAGNLWISTNRGLAVLDPETGHVRHYNTSHGLQSDEFNFAAALRARNGQMFFGGINGFNAFRPENIRKNEHVPPVVLTSFLKFNSPVAMGEPTHDLETIELSHRDSVVGFEFAALDYAAPEKNRYRFMLEGFDRDWVDLGSRRRITYTNLDPGEYTFRVKASNNDGLWNEEGLAISLVAAPPPWATWWAFAVYVLLGALGVAGFVRDQSTRRARALKLARTNRELEQEIAVRERAERELRKLSSAVEQSPASVIIADCEGRIDYVNPKFEQVTGYTRDEVRGKSLDFLHSGYTSTEKGQSLWRNVESGRPWRGEVHSRKKSGELYWEEASISPILDENGALAHLLAVNEDLTVRKQFEMRLMRQAHYDHLTGLPNRTLAMDRLERAIPLSRREKDLLAVMFLDLDNFKIVNDTLGHSAGDELLLATARRLQKTLRSSDTVARLGGDEFLLIMPALGNLDELESAAGRVLNCFAEPITVEGREIFVTASLGITVAPNDSDDPHVLLRNADAAMYKAKDAGRDAYQFFTPAMNQRAVARLKLESNLRQALDRREFFLEYQPVVDAETNRIVSAEALLRWRSPTLGQVSPGEFIPVAEDTGLIIAIGDWVLETACREARNWQSLYGDSMRIAVNISSRQMRGNNLADSVKRALELSGLPASSLELEVTEGVLLDDREDTAVTLERLHQMGVQLAVDDFGTGYSSLGYLRQFPFDLLKIDRSFILDLADSDSHFTLVRAITAMAGGLGLEVIAEGVETEAQLERLQGLGCRLIQGYYYSHPLSAPAFAGLLADGGVIRPASAAKSGPDAPALAAAG